MYLGGGGRVTAKKVTACGAGGSPKRWTVPRRGGTRMGRRKADYSKSDGKGKGGGWVGR